MPPKHINELELYRVKDVVVDQRVLPRLLGYGTATVLSADDTTPAVHLARISRPTKVKESIRSQYRACRPRCCARPQPFDALVARAFTSLVLRWLPSNPSLHS
jgi:hypothetical protein